MTVLVGAMVRSIFHLFNRSAFYKAYISGVAGSTAVGSFFLNFCLLCFLKLRYTRSHLSILLSFMSIATLKRPPIAQPTEDPARIGKCQDS